MEAAVEVLGWGGLSCVTCTSDKAVSHEVEELKEQVNRPCIIRENEGKIDRFFAENPWRQEFEARKARKV